LKRRGDTEGLRALLGPVEEAAGAAVAILLRRKGRDLQVLLVKRAANPSDPWSGHMAFPGGRRRPEDGDIRETVTRETLEETGIDLRGCRVLGAMNATTSTIAPELEVLPFVAVCDETPRITLNEELCSYFWVSLESLRRSKGTAQVHGERVPAFLVEGEVVWGLTYRMLENLLRLLETAAGAGAGQAD